MIEMEASNGITTVDAYIYKEPEEISKQECIEIGAICIRILSPEYVNKISKFSLQ